MKKTAVARRGANFRCSAELCSARAVLSSFRYASVRVGGASPGLVMLKGHSALFGMGN